MNLKSSLVWLILVSLHGVILAAPNFLGAPYNQENVVLQQGWIYNDDVIHRGIDWQRNWQPFEVNACHDGYAEYFGGCIDGDADCNGGLGNYVRIHTNIGGVDYYTIYAHLSSSPITAENVEMGQFIGMTGITGAANGVNHLHFEFHEEALGNKIDPYDIYAKAADYPPNGGSCGENHVWIECPPMYTQHTYLASHDEEARTPSYPPGLDYYPVAPGQILDVSFTFEFGH